MKIAFVGKGGGGKSTVAGLFVRHLVATNQKIMAVDADINQHFASMIGATFEAGKALALDVHKLPITVSVYLIVRAYHVGDSKKKKAPRYQARGLGTSEILSRFMALNCQLHY